MIVPLFFMESQSAELSVFLQLAGDVLASYCSVVDLGHRDNACDLASSLPPGSTSKGDERESLDR